MTLVLHLVLDTLVTPVLPVGFAVVFAQAVKSDAARKIVGGLAVAAGIAIAHLVDVGVPRVPPVDTVGWIPLATAAAVVALLVERQRAARIALTLVLTSATVWLVGRPLWDSTADLARWPLLTGIVAAAIVASLDRAARRMSPGAPLLALSFTMVGASLVCLFGHSARLGQVLGASAAVVGASSLLAFYVAPSGAVATIAVVSGAAVMAYARFYANVHMPALLLLLASAVSPIAASRFPHRRATAAVTFAIVFSAAAMLWQRG